MKTTVLQTLLDEGFTRMPRQWNSDPTHFQIYSTDKEMVLYSPSRDELIRRYDKNVQNTTADSRRRIRID